MYTVNVWEFENSGFALRGPSRDTPPMTPTGATVWAALSEAERAGAIAHAADRLRSGGLVIAPTETVYGVFANAADADAIALLENETGGTVSAGPRFTWHAPGVDEVRAVIDLPTAVHKRLVDRLWPGPVRFVFEQSAESIGAMRGSLGVGAGVIDTGMTDAGEWVAVRVPSHPVAREMLSAAGVPAVADRLGRTRFGAGYDGTAGGRSNDSRVGAAGASPDGGQVAVLDVGPLPAAPASTTVRLGLNGSIEVDGAGAVKEADVLDALRRRIVFVCTGNTCRSPMAAALARVLLEERGGGADGGVEVVIESAGVATGDGLPASPEAVEVIAEMGGDLRSHRSRRLTREIIEKADAVLAMTESHLIRAKDLAPDCEGRMSLVDPSGEVPDPIGGPVVVYRETAERLREVIGQRFEELGV